MRRGFSSNTAGQAVGRRAVLVGQIEQRDPRLLIKNPRNARTHSARQLGQLIGNIRACGFIGAVITDENHVILAGHARCEAAKQLGMRTVPTIRVSGLSDVQKRAFVLGDNKINQNAGWDLRALETELGELSELLPLVKLNFSIIGFEASEIDNLLSENDGQSNPIDELPAVEKQLVTDLGDIWTLGQHRLSCGDARSAADLDRLMAGQTAHAAFLDPPYNLEVASVVGRGRKKHAEFAFASGEMSATEFVDFLTTALKNAARISVPGAVHYVCMDWRHLSELSLAGAAVYGAVLNLCVWDKINPGQGSFYRSQHELIRVFRVGSAPSQNNIQLGRFGRNRSNVWRYPGVNGFGTDRAALRAAHPTPKPVALIADAIRDCTARGDVVVDTFAGSGSTLMAAEKTGRRGYALELEPRYVDVGVRRWQDFTKADAILAGDGRTFDEIAAGRLDNKHPQRLPKQTEFCAETVTFAPTRLASRRMSTSPPLSAASGKRRRPSP